MIIIFENGFVCDACLDYLTHYWTSNENRFNSALSRRMIILNNTMNGLGLRYLHSIGMENSYYVDLTNYIHNSIVKIDKPTNFLFFVNKSGKIIYSSYFDTGSKKNLASFINKANRYLESKKSKNNSLVSSGL